MMAMRKWRGLALYLALMWGSDALLLLASDPGARALAALILGLLPGLTLVEWIFRKEIESAVSGDGRPGLLGMALLGMGSGYALLVLGTLVAHYLPGPLTPRLLLALTNGPSLLFLLLRARTPSCGYVQSRMPWRGARDRWAITLTCLTGIVVLAAAFRLPYLGFSEFQGDEAIVMLKAAAAVQGRGDVLFLHKKGPAEILLPTALLALAGRLPESWARLPFALAGLGGVGLIYLLGRELAPKRAGLWAALLLALNGYLVAFSRIVQYQSLVFFLSGLALWCGVRFWRAKEREGRYLVLAGLFAGVGLLAHYDGAFVLPPLAYLVWDRWRRAGERRGAVRRLSLLTLALLAGILLSFYLPFVLHPHFAAARSYIGARAGGQPPYLNFRHFWINSTIYNSVYYVLVTAALLLVAAGWHLLRFLRGTDDRLAPVAWCWFAGPFIVYAFLLRDPRTHLYVLFPPWALLAGRTLAWGLKRLRGWQARTVAYGVCGAVCLLSAGYLHLAFLQHSPLYQRTYPQHRSWLYPAPYGDRFPQVGRFGFPYRAGWKVVGTLYEAGILQGDYDSNEEEPITHWYTRGAVRCSHWPRYMFVAWNVQDEETVPLHVLGEQYGERAVVEVDGQPRLTIFERDVAPATRPVVYRLAELGGAFDVEATAQGLDTGYPVRGSEAEIAHRRPVTFEGGAIHLVGYTLRSVPVQPGGAFSVSLYWEASAGVPEDYTVFVHLEGEASQDGRERIWAQQDGPPHCAEHPTSTWEPGELVTDEHTLVVAPGTPPGRYPLRIGLYILQTGRRLHAFSPEGSDLGGAVELAQVTVE
jgi:hypothetical protein